MMIAKGNIIKFFPVKRNSLQKEIAKSSRYRRPLVKYINIIFKHKDERVNIDLAVILMPNNNFCEYL